MRKKDLPSTCYCTVEVEIDPPQMVHVFAGSQASFTHSHLRHPPVPERLARLVPYIQRCDDDLRHMRTRLSRQRRRRNVAGTLSAVIAGTSSPRRVDVPVLTSPARGSASPRHKKIGFRYQNNGLQYPK